MAKSDHVLSKGNSYTAGIEDGKRRRTSCISLIKCKEKPAVRSTKGKNPCNRTHSHRLAQAVMKSPLPVTFPNTLYIGANNSNRESGIVFLRFSNKILFTVPPSCPATE